MILECAGEIVSRQATPPDIDRALAKPRITGWYLNLSSKPDRYMEVQLGASGFTVAVEWEKGLWRASAPIDESKLRALLASYLAGDGQWAELCAWTVAREAAPMSASTVSTGAKTPGFFSDKRGNPIPPPVVIVGVGFGVALTILPLIPESWLPSFIDPGLAPVLLIWLAAPALIIGLLIYKLAEARRTAKWPQAQGRIVKSVIAATHIPHMDQPDTIQQLPNIAYEFTVGGKPYRGTRVNLDELQDPAQAKAILARYPAGTRVSVHYDPINPENCVLEPGLNMPPDARKGCLTGIALLAVVGALLFAAYRNFGRLEAALPAGANARLLVFAGLFGLVFLGVFVTNLIAALKASSAKRRQSLAGKLLVLALAVFCLGIAAHAGKLLG